MGRWDEGSGVQTFHAVLMAFSTRNPNVVVPWDVRRVRVVDSERLPNPVWISLLIFLSCEEVRFPCCLRSNVASCKMGSYWIPSIFHKVLVLFKLSWVVGDPKAMQNWEIRSWKTSLDWLVQMDNSLARFDRIHDHLTTVTKCRAPNCCFMLFFGQLFSREKKKLSAHQRDYYTMRI